MSQKPKDEWNFQWGDYLREKRAEKYCKMLTSRASEEEEEPKRKQKQIPRRKEENWQRTQSWRTSGKQEHDGPSSGGQRQQCPGVQIRKERQEMGEVQKIVGDLEKWSVGDTLSTTFLGMNFFLFFKQMDLVREDDVHLFSLG